MKIFCAITFTVYWLGVYGETVSYSCQVNKVLAVSKQNQTEIDMNQVQPSICGEKRTCTYSHGKCAATGQYLSGVSNEDGKVVSSCCLYSPPVQKHAGDQCETLVIETDGHGPAVSPPRPNPVAPPKPPPSANGGGGGHSNEQIVAMVIKQTPPGSEQRLVKSIEPIKGGHNGAQGYVVTVCRPQCERTTTTRKPTTTAKPTTPPKQHSQEKHEGPHKKKLFGDGGPKCFSGDMIVHTPNGDKRMDEIRAGDQVLVTSIDSKPVYEPIEWLYHKNPDVEADFLSLTTISGRTLELSPNHLLPIVPCSTAELNELGPDHFADTQSSFARRLKPGQCIGTLIDGQFIADKVTKVAIERKRGIFSPITSQGTIIVNGVYASCFSSFENHLVQKAIHSTLIKGRRLVSPIWDLVFGSPLSQEDKNIPMPVQMLLKVAQFMLPTIVFSP